MSGIIWNILSTVIGGAIGGGSSKVIKNLPASLPANILSGGLGGLVASILGSGQLDLAGILTTLAGGAGGTAIVNAIIKGLGSQNKAAK